MYFNDQSILHTLPCESIYQVPDFEKQEVKKRKLLEKIKNEKLIDAWIIKREDLTGTEATMTDSSFSSLWI